MKIAFCGNFGVNYSSESDYLWTLRNKFGYDVTPLQENEDTAEHIEDVAMDADVFFWVHTHGWNPPGKPMVDVLKNLRYNGIPSFSYHLDLWKGLERERDLESDEFWNVDWFFTVDKLMADWLNDQGKIKSQFVRPGVVERDCYIGTYTPEVAKDVVFVGSKGYHPEWPYRPQLIDWLGETYGNSFGHYGGDGLGLMRERDLNNLYASTKIAVGDTLCLGFDYPYYVSDRVYETLGRGGFLIHPYIKGMEEEFGSDEHLVFYEFGNWEDLRGKIDYYLSHDDEREAIRLAGQQHVKENCTYTQRLDQILSVVMPEVSASV